MKEKETWMHRHYERQRRVIIQCNHRFVIPAKAGIHVSILNYSIQHFTVIMRPLGAVMIQFYNIN